MQKGLQLMLILDAKLGAEGIVKELEAMPPSGTIFAIVFPEEDSLVPWIAGRPRKFEVFRDRQLSGGEMKHARVQIMIVGVRLPANVNYN